MIWDGSSKGTLANVVNLIGAEKKVLLYTAPIKQFFTLHTPGDLNRALSASGIQDVPGFLAGLGTKAAGIGTSSFSAAFVTRPASQEN